jgi:RNA polymerase sigma factor (sigma-70 family)
VKTDTRSSASLIARAKAGDKGALDRLVARYLKPLRRWARGRLPAWARAGVDTDDIVQDSVVSSLRNLESFDPKRRGALEHYLRTAVMNKIRDQVRKQQRRPNDPLDETMVDQSPSPHEEAVAADLRARYRQALDELSDDDRRLVVAHVELLYDYEQIAVAFKKPSVDAARVAVSRAMAKLASALKLRRRI